METKEEYNNRKRLEYKNRNERQKSGNKHSICKFCGKSIPIKHKFCSGDCHRKFQYETIIKNWKSGIDNGMRGATSIKNAIRKYLFEKFENKCARCGWSEINRYSGNIPLEVEHIDGNHKNNDENNLILLCPNCHSLTATYKSLNSGHGRNRHRYNSHYKKKMEE